jgi:hypothetical protein
MERMTDDDDGDCSRRKRKPTTLKKRRKMMREYSSWMLKGTSMTLYFMHIESIIDLSNTILPQLWSVCV